MKSIFNGMLVVLLLAGCLVLGSCGGNGSQSTNSYDSVSVATTENTVDETAEVTTFAIDFAGKLSAGQLDSLKAAYPALAGAGAIVPLEGDSVMVVATSTPGQYDVTLAPGVTMNVSRATDGSMTVNETRGLFSFPADRKEIAKKTGMWDDSLNDAQMAERMNDDAFFKHIKSQTPSTSNIITIVKFVNNGNGSGYYPIRNNSGVAISGSEYTITCKQSYPTYSPEAPNAVDEWVTKTIQAPGKDLAPHGEAKFTTNTTSTFVMGDMGPEKEAKGIKWKLSKAQLQEKFASYSGNEYQEYLNSKK